MSGKKTKANRAKKQKAQTKKSSSKNRIGLIIVAILILGIIGLISYNLSKSNDKTKSRKHSHSSITAQNKNIFSCKRSPLFPTKHGLKAPYAIDLRQGTDFKGLRIIEARKNGRFLQLPGWDRFGYLGLYCLDDKGNIYTSPLPYVSIDINPPKEQNKILKVDNRTGKMDVFMNLPSTKPPDAKNPFGVIGLEFDCTTKSIYATSVAGSTYKNEAGKIFQINPETKKILDTYDNLDAMGVTIFAGKSGRRLYIGLARKPEVYSIGLNEKGGFKDDLRFEFSLKDVNGGSDVKAHRMRIKDDIMTIKAREFSYSLISASVSMRTIYKYKYNADKDKWEFLELHSENPNAHLNNNL